MIHFSHQRTAQLAQVVECTQSEGPGRRFAIWFQGCTLRCPGCCNQEMLPFSGGTRMSLDTLLARIEKAHREQQIEGITLLGGEPFAHAAFATELAIQVQRRGLSVMAFTGYTLDQLQTSMLEAASELLKRVDVLVDGPYRAHEPESRRRWIGSTNQRVHFLSDRYGDTGEWRKANTVEIRMQDGEIFVSGFPTSGMQKAFGGLPQCGPAGGSTGGAASGDEAAAGAGP